MPKHLDEHSEENVLIRNEVDAVAPVSHTRAPELRVCVGLVRMC